MTINDNVEILSFSKCAPYKHKGSIELALSVFIDLFIIFIFLRQGLTM
jgi:hypothetical protein